MTLTDDNGCIYLCYQSRWVIVQRNGENGASVKYITTKHLNLTRDVKYNNFYALMSIMQMSHYW